MNRNNNPLRAKSLNRNTANYSNEYNINMKEKQLYADRNYSKSPFITKNAPKQQSPSPFYQDDQLRMENTLDRQQKISSDTYQTPAGLLLKNFVQPNRKTDILNQQGTDNFSTKKKDTLSKFNSPDNLIPAGFRLQPNSFNYGQTDIFNTKDQQETQKGDQANNLKDPKFQKNLENFFGIEEGNVRKNTATYRNNVNRISNQNINIPNDPKFKKNLEIFFGVEEGRVNNNSNNYRSNQQQQIQKIQNDPKFQKNLENFFGVEEEKKMNSQLGSQQKVTKIPNDFKFQKNLENFFGVEVAPKNTSRNYEQSQIYNKPIPKIPNDPKFQKNLEKFFGVEDATQYNRPRATSYQQPIQSKGGQKIEEEQFKQSDSRTKLIPGAQFNNPITQEVDVTSGISGTSSMKRTVVLTEQNGSFIRQTESYLSARGILDYEIFTLPGGALGILNNEKWKLSFQEFLHWLGNVSTIYLIASLISEGSKVMLTADKSIGGMQEQLSQSKQMIQRFAGKCTINGVVLDQKGVGVRVF